MTAPLLEVRGLSIGYRDALGKLTPAVEDMSFQLEAGAAIGIVVLKPEDAEACRRNTGRTDSDGGQYADGVGRGHTSLTDSDSGDESNCGRGGGGGRGRPIRRGRGCTDSDGGRYADGVGRGRRCR